MARHFFRWQISIRVVLLVVAITCVGVWKFTPQLRAAIQRLTANVPDAPFDTTPVVASRGIWPSFREMHQWYENQFIESEFGFGLRRIVHFDDPFVRHIAVNGKLYRVQHLELVSFRDQETPIAYINAAGNPLKKTYKEAETRSLTEFERTALRKLMAGRDFVYNGDEQHARFVGAIRARKACIQCHSDATENELLGSFAYELFEIPLLNTMNSGGIGQVSSTTADAQQLN